MSAEIDLLFLNGILVWIGWDSDRTVYKERNRLIDQYGVVCNGISETIYEDGFCVGVRYFSTNKVMEHKWRCLRIL